MKLLDKDRLPEHFLATKLEFPLVGSRIIRRKRLTDVLDVGLDRHVTVVAAPVGYGKTVLLGEWLSSSRSRDALVAWLSLDTSDSEPLIFWSYVIAALHKAYPSLPLELGKTDWRKGVAGTNTVIDRLLNRVGKLPGQVCLILDNYHRITNPTIHKELGHLVDHLPRNMHLFLSTRTTPPLHLSRLRAQGQVGELSAQDLAFTFEESESFLFSVMDLRLGQHKVLSLLQRTEGWIGALQLLALAIKKTGGDSTADRWPSDNSQSLLEYTLEEILNQEDEDTRRFLLQSSVLSKLTAPLCDAVLGRTDSREMLEKTERSNLFLVPLDACGDWYRYHALFLESLRVHLQRVQPGVIHDLHCRASLWLRDNEFYEAAAYHALAAGDSGAAAEMIEHCALCAIENLNIDGLVHLINKLSDDLVKKRPRLGIYRALAYYWLGQIDLVAPMLTLVEQALDAAPENGDSIRREIAVLRAALECAHGNVSRGISSIHEIFEGATEDNYFCGMLNHIVGYAYESAGELDATVRAFSIGAEIAGKHLIAYVFSKCEVARVHIKQGHLQLAEREYRQMLDLTISSALGDEIVMFAQTGLAAVLIERNELEEAEQLMCEAIHYFSQTDAEGKVWVYSVVLRLRIAAYYLAIGDSESARVHFALARQKLRSYTGAVKNQIEDITEIRVEMWLATLNMERASGWLRKKIRVRENGGNLSIAEEVCIAKIYVALQQYGAALPVLSELEASVQKCGMHQRLIQVLTLKTSVLLLSGLKDEALESVQKLLQLAEPEGYIRQLLQLGPNLTDLIEECARTSPQYSQEYIQRLLAAYRNVLPSSDRKVLRELSPAIVMSPVVEPLSKREIEVLHMLVSGKCAKDVANSLGVSLNTAKAHIKSVYRKLDAHTQKEASRRAREMNLLEPVS